MHLYNTHADLYYFPSLHFTSLYFLKRPTRRPSNPHTLPTTPSYASNLVAQHNSTPAKHSALSPSQTPYPSVSSPSPPPESCSTCFLRRSTDSVCAGGVAEPKSRLLKAAWVCFFVFLIFEGRDVMGLPFSLIPIFPPRCGRSARGLVLILEGFTNSVVISREDLAMAKSIQ
jgi:hypothetical protein